MSRSLGLHSCLIDFCNSMNTNSRIGAMVQGWNPNVVIDSVDTGTTYTLLVRGGRVESLGEGENNASDHVVRICADHGVLYEVFGGKRNAASAFLSGDLAIYGTDRDQVKLDAIALLVWGM